MKPKSEARSGCLWKCLQVLDLCVEKYPGRDLRRCSDNSMECTSAEVFATQNLFAAGRDTDLRRISELS